MPIPNRFPIADDVIFAQRRRIERCRSGACFVELSSAFETTSPKRLEELIDGHSGKDKLGFPMWSGKYRRLIALSSSVEVSRMSDPTVEDAERTSRGKANVRVWRDHVLFDLLREPPISSEQVYNILVVSPLWIRRRIFVDDWLGDEPPAVNLSRYPLLKDVTLGIRNRKTLDAFVALLALAREAEHASHHQQHSVPAMCALEIFPHILRNHPHLRVRWIDLYNSLKTSFWSRVYGADRINIPFNFFQMHEAIVAVLRDPKEPKLPFSMGWTSAEAKRRWERKR